MRIEETYVNKFGHIVYPGIGDLLCPVRDTKTVCTILSASQGRQRVIETFVKDWSSDLTTLPSDLSTCKKLLLHDYINRQSFMEWFKAEDDRFPFTVIGKVPDIEIVRIRNIAHDLLKGFM